MKLLFHFLTILYYIVIPAFELVPSEWRWLHFIAPFIVFCGWAFWYARPIPKRIKS